MISLQSNGCFFPSKWSKWWLEMRPSTLSSVFENPHPSSKLHIIAAWYLDTDQSNQIISRSTSKAFGHNYSHIGQAFIKNRFLRCKLSIVRIHPNSATHPKERTLAGALNFHKPASGVQSTDSFPLKARKEQTQKDPSVKAVQTLLPYPSRGM